MRKVSVAESPSKMLQAERALKKLKREKRARRIVTVVGRSSDYRPEFAKVAHIVASVYGTTQTELGEFFGVDAKTIQHWMQKHPEFLRAIQNVSSHANMRVMKRTFRRATGYNYESEKVFYDSRRGKVVRAKVKEHVPADTKAAIFWLINRMPEKWRDKVELTGKDGEKLAGDIYNFLHVTVKPEEAIDAYGKLLEIEAEAIKAPRGSEAGEKA